MNAGLPTTVGRSDYAANGGDVYTSPGAPVAPLWLSAPPGQEAGPADLAEGGVNGSATQIANAKATFANIDKSATGVIHCGSRIRMANIVNGASNTYLLGEKYIGPDWYTTGEDLGDNLAALVGDNENVSRWTFLPASQDIPGYMGRWRFGSAHPAGFQMAFCDGAVMVMNYTIDPKIHRSLGNRKDAQPWSAPTNRPLQRSVPAPRQP